MRLLANHDAEVARWAGQQLGVVFYQPFAAFGVVDGSETLRGAVILGDHYRRGNVELTWVGRGTLQRGVLREVARCVFDRLSASRLTAKTSRKNRAVAKLLLKAGFRYEFTQSRYFGPDRGDDALVHVLTRDMATRWLGD